MMLRDEKPEPPRRHRRRRWMVLGGAVVLLAIGAAGGVRVLQDGADAPARKATALPTATVTRTDMVNTTDVDGTLSFAGSHTVLAAGRGRITWLPRTGQVIERGEPVYGVNGHGVPLFYGSTPFWRDLGAGVSEGRDVLELERNLVALGHGGLTVDREFTQATAQAVMAWQKDLGVTRSGTVKPDDVVMQRGAIRVTRVAAILGAPAGGTVLTASGTVRRVSVKLPVSDQNLARKGAEVRVTLPGGKTTTGRISSVGSVATAGSTNAQSQTGDGTQNATIPVSVTLTGTSGAGILDGGPATVGFTSTAHRNVLAVPINALLASADGGYRVNVVDAAGNVRPVPVRLGIFDGDDVEVAGDLTPGMKVQVPRS
jgi:peptidoglycan hydrolase-like protein with peptidoglycan-binding domain